MHARIAVQDEDPKLRAFWGGFGFRTSLRSFKGRICYEIGHFVMKMYWFINITLTINQNVVELSDFKTLFFLMYHQSNLKKNPAWLHQYFSQFDCVNVPSALMSKRFGKSNLWTVFNCWWSTRDVFWMAHWTCMVSLGLNLCLWCPQIFPWDKDKS